MSSSQGFRVHQVQELVNNPAQFWDKYQHVTTADAEGTIHTEQKHSMQILRGQVEIGHAAGNTKPPSNVQVEK